MLSIMNRLNLSVRQLFCRMRSLLLHSMCQSVRPASASIRRLTCRLFVSTCRPAVAITTVSVAAELSYGELSRRDRAAEGCAPARQDALDSPISVAAGPRGEDPHGQPAVAVTTSSAGDLYVGSSSSWHPLFSGHRLTFRQCQRLSAGFGEDAGGLIQGRPFTFGR